MSKQPGLVLDGIIKARVPKAAEKEFAAAARRRMKKSTELAREIFNAFLQREAKEQADKAAKAA